ncbi:MAG TPA: STAS domain-containing protein [Candidatus Sulfotelmatobacter sp.]|nr:STAS domain-containing protein [Candidatus Sulfotelmatobacter sp.]
MEYRIYAGEGGKSVIECSGRLTFTNSSAFMRITEELRAADGKSWVLDLSRLEFIDSAGLGMLLMARDILGDHKGRLTLKAAQGQVAKALSLARFDELIQIEA